MKKLLILLMFVLLFVFVSCGIISKLEWSNIAPNSMTWGEAKKYCENLKEGGYSDWRLPTISEFRTLIQNCPATETGGECKVTDSCLLSDKCSTDACLGCKYFEDGRYSKLGDTEWFWSSSEPGVQKVGAWTVSFNLGSVSPSPKFYFGKDDIEYDKHNVRCVR